MMKSKCVLSAKAKIAIIAVFELIVVSFGIIGTAVTHKLFANTVLESDAFTNMRIFLVLQYMIWIPGMICVGFLFYGISTQNSNFILLNVIVSNMYNLTCISFVIWHYFSVQVSDWRREDFIFLLELMRIGCMVWNGLFFFFMAAKISFIQKIKTKTIDLVLQI